MKNKNKGKTGRGAKKPKNSTQPPAKTSTQSQPKTPSNSQNPPQFVQQPRCRLLGLPKELRDEIYSWTLSSTRITFGEDPSLDCAIKKTIKMSRPHPLALLYTCRQIQAEIGSQWISWILFNFRTPEALLDILTNLSAARVAAIRHVRVNGRPVLLTSDDDYYYRLPWVLKVVPQLQLDTLTVLGGSAPNFAGGPAQCDYKTLDDLVQYGTGFRELRYITPNSSLLSFKKTESYRKTYIRKPQPEQWRSMLLQRDGADSGASVTICRSMSNIPGSIIDPDQQRGFQQIIPPEPEASLVHMDNLTVVFPGKVEDFGMEKDPFLSSPTEQDKELLVVVKRGRNADILENTPKPPYNKDYDLRALTRRKKWSEVRLQYTEGAEAEDDPYTYGGYVPRHTNKRKKTDTYGYNAHEIAWVDNEVGGSQSDDWSEQKALDWFRDKFVTNATFL